MQQEGLIMRVEEKQAWVQVLRESACGSCHTCGGCEVKGRLIQVQNPLGFGEGERVWLRTEPKKLLVSSVVVYSLPLAGLFLGYAVGHMTLGHLGEGWAVGTSLVGLGLSLPALRWLDRRWGQGVAVSLQKK